MIARDEQIKFMVSKLISIYRCIFTGSRDDAMNEKLWKEWGVGGRRNKKVANDDD